MTIKLSRFGEEWKNAQGEDCFSFRATDEDGNEIGCFADNGGSLEVSHISGLTPEQKERLLDLVGNEDEGEFEI